MFYNTVHCLTPRGKVTHAHVAPASRWSKEKRSDHDRSHTGLRDRRRHHGARHRPGRAVGRTPRQPGRSRREPARRAAVEDISQRLARRQPDVAARLHDRPRHTHRLSTSHRALGSTLVIEAVLESLEVKRAVLSSAAEHFGEGCILATNTSSLSVTEIAAGTAVPESRGRHALLQSRARHEARRGRHRGADRSPGRRHGRRAGRSRGASRSRGCDLRRASSSTASPRAFYGEALRLVEEQVAPPATIDEVMRAAGQFRMGPFELMDLIGNDVNAAVTRSVWTAFNYDPRFEPSRIQDELVAAGRYGTQARTGLLLVRRGRRAQRSLSEWRARTCRSQ